MVENMVNLRWQYFVMLWSGPEKLEQRIEVESIEEADRLVREEIGKRPEWRATIYPRQRRELDE